MAPLKTKIKGRGAAGYSPQQATNEYGTALGDVAGQAYQPLRARVSANVMERRANQSRMAALNAAAATSEATYGAEQGALQTGYQQEQDLVKQNARPSLITAKSAIAQANDYAKRIGINIKDMNWQAKAAVYQAIITQNTDILKMQFQQQLDQQNYQYQYDLQTKAATEQELKTAPTVVNTVNSNMPSMIAAVQAYANDSSPDKLPPAQAAAQWASGQTGDTNAQGVLASVMTTLLAGADAHTHDNVLDGNWIRNTVVNSVHSLYPDYNNDQAITSALSNGVLSGMLLPGASEDWINDAYWNQVLQGSYQNWATNPAQGAVASSLGG